MASKALIARWAKESLAMMMVGDALVTFVDPQRHCRLWMKGPAKWRQFVNLFVQHPGVTRGLALGELGLGMWLAEKQRPMGASLMKYESHAGAAD
ncbi:MAG TPA: hypothetical protein VJM12_22660 [Pyrinomonadaceae bacterium]|nr:hypothetical protein [Pyrinomonadaceae bacterium]